MKQTSIFFIHVIKTSSVPLSIVGKTTVRIIAIPIYTLYLAHKKTVNRVVGLRKNTLLVFLANRYIVHVTVGVLAAFVMMTNIHTRNALAEDLSRDMMIARLLNQSEDLIIEDAETIPTETALATTQGLTYPAINVTRETTDKNNTIIERGIAVSSPNVLPTDAATSPTRTEAQTYLVGEGDSISAIANRFGISASTILWANNLSTRSVIRPGDKLTILPIDGIRHKVARGETLGGIAKKYNINTESIANANKISNTGKIAIGDLLIIPGGKPLPTYIPRQTIARTDQWTGSVPNDSTGTPSGSGFVWPSPGKRINQYYTLRHHGLDIDNNTANDAIYAISDGRVETAGWSTRGYGNYVIINHGNGTQSLYGHLKNIFVKHGQQVTQGQTIGIMGTTGRSTGIHLHFEIRINGRTQNPFNFY